MTTKAICATNLAGKISKNHLFVFVIAVSLQLQHLNHIQCAPIDDNETVAANMPPLIYPVNLTTVVVAADQPASFAPRLFPTDPANLVVQQDNAPLPPALFPTNRADIIRVAVPADRQPKPDSWLRRLPPCAANEAAAGKLPPCLFPTARDGVKFRLPADNNQLMKVLSNRRNLKKVLEHNPEDDAVRLEDNDRELESPMQLEELFGSQSNSNLVSMNTLTLDDSIVVDRPNDATGRNVMLSLTLTGLVLAVCALLSLMVWRKYVQHKYGLREQLLTEEEGFVQP